MNDLETLEPSERNRRVEILRNVGESRSATGRVLPREKRIGRLWVRIRTTAGGDRFFAEQAGAGITHLVDCSYSEISAGVRAGDHLERSNGSRLYVEHVNDPEDRHSQIVLSCRETKP